MKQYFLLFICNGEKKFGHIFAVCPALAKDKVKLHYPEAYSVEVVNDLKLDEADGSHN
jgi:hypothetical protein